MSEPFVSAIGGPVQAIEGTYLRRKADDELYQACRTGQFAYVLGSRQIGKSSLMVETSRKLQQEGFKTALLELNTIGRNVNLETWYFSLTKELATLLGLDIQVQDWWGERDKSAPTQRFVDFLRDVVLKKISDQIVIFIDEIDVTLGFDFKADDFFAAIRTVHNNRAQYPDYKRLTFVLLGVATPDDLIRDNDRTPFNIGRAIPLPDFTKEECHLFLQEIQAKYPEQGRHYFDRIYDLTNGHPYLTQRLCTTLLEWDGSEPSDEARDLVDTLAERTLLSAPTDRGDVNLQFVQDRVTTDQHTGQMLRIYQQILQDGVTVVDDEKSSPINRLKLYGLVIAQEGQLQVRNKLYAQIFDLEWVNKILKVLTPQLGIPSYYKILQTIGKGAYATVYLAETDEFQGVENVALKALDLPDVSEPKLREVIYRFNQEAETLRRLDHPNIITLFESNRSEVGQGDKQALYIAMEYIPGGSLRQRLENGPLARNEAVGIVRQIGSALTYAHERDIIHRDVTPNDILLDNSQQPIRAVLTDFGLIKLLQPPDLSKAIKSILPVGTAQYMPPEQFDEAITPTPAMDIYALGITFFEMLARQRPLRQSDGTISPLSSVVPEIGPVFDEVLIKATAQAPMARYQNMTDFIEAIEAANQQATEMEIKRQHAAGAVEAVRAYAQMNPTAALAMVEAILGDDPNYVDGLRLKGEIFWGTRQYEEALKIYQQAYQLDHRPDSAAGQDYLNILKDFAKRAWDSGQHHVANQQYAIIQKISNKEQTSPSLHKIWEETRAELIRKHQREGEQIYALGEPDNFDQAIADLILHIDALQALASEQALKDLRDKQRLLQIKKIVQEGEVIYSEGEPENIEQAIETLTDKIWALDELKAITESHRLQRKQYELQVRQHLDTGEIAFAQGNPKNIVEAIGVLDREIKNLEALGAVDESQVLKKNSVNLHIKRHYEDGQKAFTKRDSHQLETAIKNLENLGTIRGNEAIEALRENVQKLLIQQYYEPGLKAYNRGLQGNVTEAIEIIQQVMDDLEKLNALDKYEELHRKLRHLQIKRHYEAGLEAYSEGNPNDLIWAISRLESEIEALEKLEATKESQELKNYQKELQIERYQRIILAEQTAIDEANALADFTDETIFQHYRTIDETYYQLIDLEPANEKWVNNRQRNLRVEAKNRYSSAEAAQFNVEPNYEVALKHYYHIQELEQKQYPGLAQDLEIDDLPRKIASCKQQAEFEGKYNALLDLIDAERYSEALDYVREYFIVPRYEDYRDAAGLFKKLVYAKEKGHLPSDNILQNFSYTDWGITTLGIFAFMGMVVIIAVLLLDRTLGSNPIILGNFVLSATVLVILARYLYVRIRTH